MISGIRSVEDLGKLLPQFVVHNEDFQFVKSIGKGGFSEVFSASYTPTKQMCAVKKLKFRDLSGKNFEALSRELQILSKNAHPYLLGFVGFSIDRPFIIVTEYLPNGSLFDALRWKDNHKPLTGTQKTLIAMCIASGMAKLHKNRIMHRDIKSLNILLDEDLLPRVIDFGLSKFYDEKDETLTEVLGTTHWMAPELFENKGYTNKIDVYAYGVLLWEMLTNSIPYAGKSNTQIIYDVVKKGKRPPIPIRTPSGLKNLINACWDQNPNNRPTFKEVFQQFASNVAYYDGTNKDDIASQVTKIKISKHSPKSFKQPEGLRASEIKSYEQPKDDFEILIKLDSLVNINRQDYEAILKEIISILPSDYADSFFGVIGNLLAPTTPFKILQLLLSAIEKFIYQEPIFYKVFIQKKIYTKLTFKDESVAHQLLGIYLQFFSNSPAEVSDEIVDTVKFYIPTHPMHVLRLINAYTCNKRCRKSALTKFWSFADMVFQYDKEFINGGVAQGLAKLIFTLLALYPQFLKARLQYIQNTLKSIIMKGGNEAAIALDMMCAENDLHIALPENFVSQNLDEPMLGHRILTWIIKCPQFITESVIQSLIALAEKSIDATLVLCEVAKNPDNAKIIFSSMKSWIVMSLPTLEYTLKLLMVILSHKFCRTNLPQEIIIFLQSVLENEGDIYETIYPIFMTIEITPAMVKLSQQFIERLFDKTFQRGNSDLIIESLRIIKKIAEVGYSPGFITILPYIHRMITTNGWAVLVVPIVALFSKHPEMKEHLSGSKILREIQFIKDESVQADIGIIRSNIPF